jgi:hypothetical protein
LTDAVDQRRQRRTISNAMLTGTNRNILIGGPEMNDTPLYSKARIRLLGMNHPPVIVVAALGAALQRIGVDREEIDRVFDEIHAEGADDIVTACSRYVCIER